jgi:hypothetical protein
MTLTSLQPHFHVIAFIGSYFGSVLGPYAVPKRVHFYPGSYSIFKHQGPQSNKSESWGFFPPEGFPICAQMLIEANREMNVKIIPQKRDFKHELSIFFISIII